MILKLTNKSKNFYANLGKVFGSREVQKITGDRFYDDDNKIWYVYYSRGNPDTFVSVQSDKIKNVWTEHKNHLIEVLNQINKEIDVMESVVPAVFKDEYEKAGFLILGNGYKNFIRIRGEESDR
ncbi:hypothetical protein [Bacillus smithii]|uniref:hypothetical protein n=1 Tax=Bacillus smithii TaxID=1479 RepID=UPI003D1C1511